MEECLKCKSPNIVSGYLAVNQHSLPVRIAFVPDDLKWYQFSLEGGAELTTEAHACADCCTVWTAAKYPEQLRKIFSRFAEKQPEDKRL